MLREGTEQSSQISQARRETCSHGVESSRARSAQNRTISITSELTRVRFVRRRQTSLGEDHFRVRKGEVLQQAGSAGPERHAASRLHSRLGKTQTDLERCAAPRPPTSHPGGPEPAPSNKPASVENLFPRSSAATSAGPSRPRTISAPPAPWPLRRVRTVLERCDLFTTPQSPRQIPS